MSACIEWIGGKCKAGYGRRWYKGKLWGAHRAALDELGKLNPALQVLHKCDNPSCVNPEHLFQGTQKENMQDKVQKGRSAKGKYSFNGKTQSLEKWAAEYGISYDVVKKRYYRDKWPLEKALTIPKGNYHKSS